MARYQEKELPLRCTLRLQKKSSDTEAFIQGSLPLWQAAVKAGKLISGTVFALDDQIFVYYEARESFHLEEYLPGIEEYVFLWPGQDKLRPYVPMIKYYQSMPMEEVRDWNREENTIPRIMVNRMKLDKLQSYIYVHYLMQEEQPGRNGRFFSIWGSEDWCVLYNQDNPKRPIDTDYQGQLTTHNLPEERLVEYMMPHFHYWEDGKLQQQAEILLHVQ